VLRFLLDAAIVAYVVAIVLAVGAGGIDLGIVSVRRAAKPVLFLLILVPVRGALGGSSPLAATLAPLVGAARAVLAGWPPAVRAAAFAFATTGGASLLIASVANALIVPSPLKPAMRVPMAWGDKLFETLAVWDSAWYLDIARRGYVFDPDGQSSVAFFPLYPLLIRAGAVPFGGSETALWTSAVVVSWVAFLAALTALHRLTERMAGSEEAARRAVLYTAVFPVSFYFFRIYTEALFLLWTVLAVLAAVEARWGRAGAFGALAALTRPNGVLIVLPLLVLACGGRPDRRMLGRRLLALVPIPLALAAYSVYVWTLAGSPLAWLDAQAQWAYSLGHLPYRHVLNVLVSIEDNGFFGMFAASSTAAIEFFYVLVALLFLGLVPAIGTTFGPALGLYVLVGIAIPLSGNALVGIGRYASVLFPTFMFAATIRCSRAQHAILVVSALFYTLFLILFVAWYPLH
jgi:hypothetical protein